MILLKEITTPSVFYPEAEALLIDAFPVEERRPLEQQRDYTDHNRLFQAQAIIADFDFAGIINTWNLGEATYIEHLAVKEELRGQGIATEALTRLKLRGKPIILEVEPPHNQQSEDRIRFYERNGFKTERIEYEQPPYSNDLPSVPLNIMTFGKITDLNAMIKTLKSVVYSKTDNN